MDYLRTLGSAAVSTLVQKSGLNLPYSLGQKVTVLDGIVTLYDATRRDDGSPVSVFEYDFSDHSKKHIRPYATNALRKLRTTRHPDVLKFMDAVETDLNISIMTERVRPLQAVLQSWSSRAAKEREEWLVWGLHRISIALTFINDPCASTHGKITINSIFVSHSGEWKLGGFELFSNTKDDSANLYSLGGLYPDSSSWTPPEVKKAGWTALKDLDAAVADAYALGLLLHSVFNPTQPQPATTVPPHPPPGPAARGSIPAAIFPSFKNLLNPNPKARLTAKGFLSIGMTESGFFTENRLVTVCAGLENFSIASESEKTIFLRTLKESATSFPSEFSTNHLLPSLISALEFGGASATSILPLVLQFGANVSPEEYPKIVLTPVVKLYASPDRGTRMALLDHLPEYIDRLDKATVSDKIFPHLSTGFTDTVAVIREATTKSISLLAPKLTDRLLNNDLLRHLAHMQTDSEPSIRTNTCILLGRLGPTLGYNTKKKVLVPAFVRAMKDSFVHARVAGLMAFMATIDCFDAEDIATKVIPNLAPGMIDKEKTVRNQAFKAVELYIKKLEGHAATMPETELSEVPRSVALDQAVLVNSAAGAAGAAGALAGWAISSLGKKLMTTDLQSTIGTTTTDESGSGSTSATVEAVSPRKPSFPPKPSMTSPTFPSSTKPKGMQLGGTKSQQKIVSAVLAEEWADEAADGNPSPWGTDDLIDINADQDDWSAFETAPPAILEPKPTPASSGFSNLGFANGSSYPSRLQPSSHTNTPSRTPTPASLAATRGTDSAWGENAKTPSPAPPSLSKEEKAAEMAKRKEERKQRIAMLKEQKKGATRT